MQGRNQRALGEGDVVTGKTVGERFDWRRGVSRLPAWRERSHLGRECSRSEREEEGDGWGGPWQSLQCVHLGPRREQSHFFPVFSETQLAQFRL
jgi:hypothetical protein